MHGKLAKAMVLAAGYGARLKPLTDRTPKPLVPVAGKPMIEYALEKLKAYGIEELVINVSHLREQLTAYLARSGLDIRLSEEAEPLETGGGLRNALPLLGQPLLRHQQRHHLDRWTGHRPETFDPRVGRQPHGYSPPRPVQGQSRRIRHWRRPSFRQARQYGFRDDREAPYIVAGLGIVHPRVLARAPAGKFSAKVLWRQALSQDRLACLPHHGRWFQTGTIRDIENAERLLPL